VGIIKTIRKEWRARAFKLNDLMISVRRKRIISNDAEAR